MPAAPHAWPDRRASRRAAAAVLGVAIALLASVALVATMHGEARTLATNLVGCAFAAAGAIGCARGAAQRSGPPRRGWIALAVACSAWGGGQVAWTF